MSELPSAHRISARLFTHGNEHHSLGGPSLRVPRTAEVLRAQGIPAQFAPYEGGTDFSEAVAHIFNVWTPATALAAIRDARDRGKFVVFSPIFLDLREIGFWHHRLPGLLSAQPPPPWQEVAAEYTKARKSLSGRSRHYEPVAGYHSMVRQMISLADHIVLLSEAEKSALEAVGVDFSAKPHSLVRNPVDADAWRNGDPALFRQIHGDGAFVLCVGRIEPRKNQLMLAEALRDTGLRLVLAGHDGSADYRRRIEAPNLPNVEFLGRLEPGSPMLKSALSAAAAFVLPSWCEGAPLAALEAAAAGASLVLSTKSSEQEYFGDLARYCDPGDPASIRDAVLAAVAAGPEPERRAALQALVRDRHSWERYAADTAQVYVEAMKQPRPTREKAPAQPLANSASDAPVFPASALPQPLCLGELAPAGREQGHAGIHFGAGWAEAETWGRWSASPEARFSIRSAEPLSPGRNRPFLYLRLQNYLSTATVPFEVLAGERVLYSAEVNQTTFPRELWLPTGPELFDDNSVVEVTLRLPPRPEVTADATNQPREHGVGLIALALLDLNLSNPLCVSDRPQHWSFGDAPLWLNPVNTEHRQMLNITGLVDPAWGLAAQQGMTGLNLPLLPDAPPQRMTLSLRPVATPADPVRLRIYLGDRRLAEAELIDDSIHDLHCEIPSAMLPVPAQLRIEANSQATPAQRKLGGSEQVQGFGVIGVSLEPIVAGGEA